MMKKNDTELIFRFVLFSFYISLLVRDDIAAPSPEH